jgi:beta-lactamase class A
MRSNRRIGRSATRLPETRLRVGLPPDWRIGDKTGQSKRRTTSAFLGRSSVNQSW